MVHSTASRRSISRSKFEVDDHDAFLSRIKKTLYYGRLPQSPRFSLPVSELAAEFFTEVKRDHSIQSLDLGEAASFSRTACVSPCCLVLALLYLDRLKSRDPEYIKRVAPSELFVVSLMVASKFLHDDGEEGEVFNDKWAVLAGVDPKEMNKSERDFLHAIGWEVYVNGDSFSERLHGLEKNIALREGKKRGWFSYTDLDILMEQMHLARLAHTLLSVSAVCLTSYTASVLTLLGSALIVSHIPGSTLVSLLNSPTTNLSVHYHSDLTSSLPANFSVFEFSLLSFISSSVILNSIESFNQTGIWTEADIEQFENESMGLNISDSLGSLLQSANVQKCQRYDKRRWSEELHLPKKLMSSEELEAEDSVEVACTVLSTNR